MHRKEFVHHVGHLPRIMFYILPPPKMYVPKYFRCYSISRRIQVSYMIKVNVLKNRIKKTLLLASERVTSLSKKKKDMLASKFCAYVELN